MSTAWYCRPTDIVTADFTITASAPDPGYPPTLLGNKNPAYPAKLTTTTGWFLLTASAPVSIDLVTLVQHNLDAGLAVYVQGNATDVWTSPTLNVAFTIPANRADRFRWNVLADLSALGSRSFQYWRIYISGTNSAAIAIGELLMITTKRTLERNLEASFTRELNHPVVEHKTDAGVSTIYDLGVSWETIRGTIKNTSTGADSQETLFRSSGGRSEGFLFVQDPGISEPLYVRRVDSKLNITFPWTNRAMQVHAFEVEEISRGLYL